MYKNSRIRAFLVQSQMCGRQCGHQRTFSSWVLFALFVPCLSVWLLVVVDERMCGGRRVCTDLGEGVMWEYVINFYTFPSKPSTLL